MPFPWISAAVGYLLGSISCGILVPRLFGQGDIRKTGSGNAGTTNVLRSLGWLPGVLTLMGDALKSVLACLIGNLLGGTPGMLTAGFFAVLGHVFPLYFRFRGGKGIAAAFGMILASSPLLGLILFAAEVVIVALTRYMSVASLANVVLYPLLTLLFFGTNANREWFVIYSLLTSLLVLYAHRANVGRLLRQEENRLDFRRIKIGTGRKD